MANEIPKKPIRRVPVPSVSKDAPTKQATLDSESKAGQNFLLFLIFLFVSGLVYLAIFQKELILKYSAPQSLAKIDSTISQDSLSDESKDSLALEEVDTFIGQNKKPNNNSSTVYPAGTKYYLVAGTFIFYPYAEKCKNKMVAAGYDAEIISTGDERKFHRIYIGSSEDPVEMRTKRDELRNSKGMDVWVYAE